MEGSAPSGSARRNVASESACRQRREAWLTMKSCESWRCRWTRPLKPRLTTAAARTDRCPPRRASCWCAVRRHVVTEVFGLDQPATVELIEAMKAAGYRTEVVGVRASVEQSVAWNEERGLDNVSSYFTDNFNVRWLRDAARAYVESMKEG